MPAVSDNLADSPRYLLIHYSPWVESENTRYNKDSVCRGQRHNHFREYRLIDVFDGLHGAEHSADKHAEFEQGIDTFRTYYVVKIAKKYIVILYFHGELHVSTRTTGF